MLRTDCPAGDYPVLCRNAGEEADQYLTSRFIEGFSFAEQIYLLST